MVVPVLRVGSGRVGADAAPARGRAPGRVRRSRFGRPMWRDGSAGGRAAGPTNVAGRGGGCLTPSTPGTATGLGLVDRWLGPGFLRMDSRWTVQVGSIAAVESRASKSDRSPPMRGVPGAL